MNADDEMRRAIEAAEAEVRRLKASLAMALCRRELVTLLEREHRRAQSAIAAAATLAEVRAVVEGFPVALADEVNRLRQRMVAPSHSGTRAGREMAVLPGGAEPPAAGDPEAGP